MSRPKGRIYIRNREHADDIARTYIEDDRYLVMNTERMLLIAMVLKDRVSDNLVPDILKIIEVCTPIKPYITRRSRMDMIIV